MCWWLLYGSQIMYRYLQVAIHISNFLKVAKQNKYTYKGSSNKSLFFHKTSVKATPPASLLFHHEALLKYIISVITMAL